MRKRPEAAGLYDPGYEHDNCGIGAVADLTGAKKHETVTRALTVLDHLEHRGASGAEIDTGDGAGLLCQVPDEFFRGVLDFELPQPGEYAVGVLFLPSDDEARRQELEELTERTIAAEGQTLLGWRDVPVDHSVPGQSASEVEPTIRQVFIGKQLDGDQDAFERKVYVIRRVIEREAGEDLAIPSFSSKTVVYKGMLTSPQLPRYYEDLGDERFKTAVALVHSRFSTNTFPSWELAHPYRIICHNGEINTLRGNINWMRARESTLASDLFGDDLEKVIPAIKPKGSDSATFDNALELLVMAGRSLPHALMMMVPEAWENHTAMPDWLRDFYAFHSCLMEPWDGPGQRGVLRRHVAGRHARPQRTAARPVAGDQGRLRRDGIRDGRARVPAGPDRAQGPARARQHLHGRPRQGAHRRGR